MLSKPQFECVLQPDGLWTIWNNGADHPTMADSIEPLVLDRSEALVLGSRLNADEASELKPVLRN